MEFRTIEDIKYGDWKADVFDHSLPREFNVKEEEIEALAAANRAMHLKEQQLTQQRPSRDDEEGEEDENVGEGVEVLLSPLCPGASIVHCFP